MISILVLAALITWHGNSASGKAPVFGGIYAGIFLVLGLVAQTAGGSLTALLISAAIRFGAATLMFWLMDRFHGLLGWIIAILGTLALSFAF